MKILPPIYNEQNPLVQPDYPYGRLRCERRIWIETNGKGSRFCSQTINPKTGRINKPDKSTYAAFMVLKEDEKGHVHPHSVALFRGSEALKPFLEENRAGMTSEQIANLEKLIPAMEAFEEKMSKRKWVITESEPVRIV